MHLQLLDRGWCKCNKKRFGLEQETKQTKTEIEQSKKRYNDVSITLIGAKNKFLKNKSLKRKNKCI